jgi:hypothetical protein
LLRYSSMAVRNYYTVLGISSQANAAEIKKAYHRLALKFHPDKNPGDAEAPERFKEVLEAYQVLIDPGKRSAYDLRSSGFSFSESLIHYEYLKAEVDTSKVKLNEEVELTFSFPGEGRFFRKPVLQGWIITAGPTVDHRVVHRDGNAVKETVLHYTVCPLQKGWLTIPPASINFYHHPIASNALQIEVESNQCFFKENEEAGPDPCQIMMHRTQVTSTSVYRKTIIHQRVVLLPRSELAAWYHKVGRTMKIAFAVIGAFWAIFNDYNFITGIVAGSLVAGVNVQLMYRMMGIKSIFYYAHHHPVVLEYEGIGYKLGAEPYNGIFSAKTWVYIKSIFK